MPEEYRLTLDLLSVFPALNSEKNLEILEYLGTSGEQKHEDIRTHFNLEESGYIHRMNLLMRAGVINTRHTGIAVGKHIEVYVNITDKGKEVLRKLELPK